MKFGESSSIPLALPETVHPMKTCSGIGTIGITDSRGVIPISSYITPATTAIYIENSNERENVSVMQSDPEARHWGGLPIAMKEVFNCGPESHIPKDNKAADCSGQFENYPDQYAHFSKPSFMSKNRARMSRARNQTTIYRRIELKCLHNLKFFG